jgi:filamentous hemagglutinin family protein
MATTKIGSASRVTSASNRKQRASRLFAALIYCTSPLALMAQDLPTGGQVAAGGVQIGTPGAGGMTVTQSTDTAIVNWNSFDVGAGQTLRFDQPNTDAAILNRVTGDTGTDIHGRITANGQVHIVNPNGIFIGPNGMVQAGGGFVASTLDITDQDFQSGTYRYRGDGQSGTVVNGGTIQIGRGGYAALLGGHVSNTGRVSVPMGRVGFASGERVTLDVSGDGFLQVAVPTSAESAEGQALIENAGTVSAQGGRIEMKAATARHAVRNAINLSGVAEASSVSVRGGTIVLGGGAGGQVRVTGRVTARSNPPRRDVVVTSVVRPVVRPGGQVTVTGQQITLDGATLDVSGTGGGGLIRVGGDFAGGGPLPRAAQLTATSGTTVRADALTQGDGGRIVLWSDVLTNAAATFSARGGPQGGNGGFIEVSSADTLNYSGRTDTRAPLGDFGMLLLDPRNITISAGAGGELTLEDDLSRTDVTLDTSDSLGLSSFDAGNITINANIDWTASTTLYLLADNNIVLNRAINGPNGGLYLGAGNAITTGAGGRVDVADFVLAYGDWSQVGTLPAFAADNFAIYSGSFLRAAAGNGGTIPYRIVDVFGLQGVGSSNTLLSVNYILGADIDASGTSGWSRSPSGTYGFQPIAGVEPDFSGDFDGNGHSVSGLTIVQYEVSEGTFVSDASMFGTIGSNGSVHDLTLTDVDIAGYSSGAVATANFGDIRAVSVTGNVSGAGGAVGGIVGSNYGTISDSRADVDVFGDAGVFFDVSAFRPAGGAIGYNAGVVDRVHALGDVAISDEVTSDTALLAGGFVGLNDGTIRGSYARGAVSVTNRGGGTSSTINAGGFAGAMESSGLITRSYATGRVTTAVSGSPASVAVGGFAGRNAGAATPSNFWDVTTSGRTNSAAGTGLTTAQFQNTAFFMAYAAARGWVFTGTGAVWAPGQAGYYPVNYTTSPVVFVAPTAISVIYGETDTTVAPGTITGGPASYVFDDPADVNFAPGDLLGSLVFANTNVGTTTYGLGLAQIGYPGSEVFTVVARPATATITPRALTITANDAATTYGQGVTFGLDDVTVAQDNGTDATGLVAGDSVTNITLRSDGAAVNANASDTPYDITASGATGTGLSNYTITYVDGDLSVGRAALTITATDQSNIQGQTFVFNGTEFTVVGLVVAGDSVDFAQLGSAGASATATAAGSPYVISISDASGSGLGNYDITYVGGSMTVAAPPPPPPPPPAPPAPPLPVVPAPIPVFSLPNPLDAISANIDLGRTTVAGVASAGGSGIVAAAETLSKTRNIGARLTVAAQSCSSSNADVTRYLACLSEALNDFAGELDAIAVDLPPGLANVAQIVQDARREIDAASSRAQRRLAGATSAAERSAIGKDAVNEARAALSTAAIEIRKAISLERVEDPELAGLQRETIITVASAVDSVNIELSRAVGL